MSCDSSVSSDHKNRVRNQPKIKPNITNEWIGEQFVLFELLIYSCFYRVSKETA